MHFRQLLLRVELIMLINVQKEFFESSWLHGASQSAKQDEHKLCIFFYLNNNFFTIIILIFMI